MGQDEVPQKKKYAEDKTIKIVVTLTVLNKPIMMGRSRSRKPELSSSSNISCIWIKITEFKEKKEKYK